MSFRRLNRGLSLLELLLSVALISLLLVVCTRYFLSVQNTQRVQHALSQLQVIRVAAATYAEGGSSYAGVSMQTLQAAGLLPKDIIGTDTNKPGTGVNPWSGDITIQTQKSDSGVFDGDIQISFTDVPYFGCEQLSSTLKQQANKIEPATCNTKSTNNFSASFS